MEKNIIKSVREKYGSYAKSSSSCGCGCSAGKAAEYAQKLGYTDAELKVIPADANLALSCGNPTALVGLKEWNVVVDLGSGAGFDCFLAASRVGDKGKVIGVDMTPEMVDKARSIAARDGISNVEFRLGEIENLPVADNSADVVISNCVVNLSANKPRVFAEIHRVLKPGGKVAIADIALREKLPEQIKESIEAYVGCVAGAVLIEEYRQMLLEAGFKEVSIIDEDTKILNQVSEDPMAKSIMATLKPGQSVDTFIASVKVEAIK
jgi:ubiquinone/menaquinone biosynthesis C-methylase UbiE